MFYAVMSTPENPADPETTSGKTMSIGTAMYTEYLLPVEIVGVMLLMAIIGAVMLVRKLDQPNLELVLERSEEQDKFENQ